MAQPDVFHLDLNQFADSCASGREKTDDEIPEQLIVPLQAGFEVFIVGLADDILQKRLLLHPDKGLLPFLLADTLQVAVDSPEAQVYSLRLVAVNQPCFVAPKVLLRDRAVRKVKIKVKIAALTMETHANRIFIKSPKEVRLSEILEY